MIKQLLVILVLFSFISIGYSTWCYQESANSSHINDGGCNLDYSGTYYDISWRDTMATTLEDRFLDGNWTTGDRGDIDWNSRFTINYTKPSYSQNTSYWQIKDNLSTINLSIPIDCWNYDINKISLKGSSTYMGPGGDHKVDWFCYNGTWKNLRHYNDTNTYFTYIFEEAMWWNLSEPQTNQAQSSAFPFQNITSLILTLFTLFGFLVFS